MNLRAKLQKYMQEKLIELKAKQINQQLYLETFFLSNKQNK